MVMKTLLCSLQEWARCFIRNGDKATSKEEDPKRRFKKKKEEMGPCYHCKKMCHLIANCPSLQATPSKKVHKKKKVMVATWDDSET